MVQSMGPFDRHGFYEKTNTGYIMKQKLSSVYFLFCLNPYSGWISFTWGGGIKYSTLTQNKFGN